MRVVLAFDLAARYSAACLLREGEVAGQWTVDVGPASDTWHAKYEKLTHFFTDVFDAIYRSEYPALRIGVEDVHAFAVNPKPAMRLQGALFGLLAQQGVAFELVTANAWQKHFGYKKKKGVTSKGWAKEKVAEFGYEVPEWAKGKQLEDCRDAYLIARYLDETRVSSIQ